MKRIRTRKKIKLSTKILFIVLLVFFLTFIMVDIYYEKVNDKIINVARLKLQKMTTQFLSSNVGYDILKDTNLEEMIVINQNTEGEILYVDYNLDKAYYVLDLITDEITKSINDLEKGNIKLDIYDRNLKSNDYGLMLELPLFMASDNALFSNLGPKVYLQLNFVGSILTNIRTQLTNYGINSALMEIFVTIEVNEEIISPVVKENENVYYEVLIGAKVINGRVPEIYGGSLSKSSQIYSANIEEN